MSEILSPTFVNVNSICCTGKVLKLRILFQACTERVDRDRENIRVPVV